MECHKIHVKTKLIPGLGPTVRSGSCALWGRDSLFWWHGAEWGTSTCRSIYCIQSM